MERFVIIEDFNGTIALVTDENGNPKLFGSFSEAVTEAGDCQNGVIVPLEFLSELTQLRTINKTSTICVTTELLPANVQLNPRVLPSLLLQKEQ